MVGAGGFGGKRASDKAKVCFPYLSYATKTDKERPQEFMLPLSQCVEFVFYSPQAPLPPPKRAPDAVVIDSTTRDQVSVSVWVFSHF